jgi:inhibitor of cysteine peptidase
MAVIRLDEGHDGTQVDAHVGDTIDVLLPENATTGYQWEVDAPGEALDVQTSELLPPDDPRAGATGRRHVVVHVSRVGDTRLSMRLRRRWDPPEKAEGTYAVDVVVT